MSGRDSSAPAENLLTRYRVNFVPLAALRQKRAASAAVYFAPGARILVPAYQPLGYGLIAMFA